MEKLQWDDSFDVGIKSVDEEHLYLVRLFNDLAEQINHNGDERIISGILGYLASYVMYHCEREEAIMKIIEFPELDSHIKEHQMMAKAFNETCHGFMDEEGVIDYDELFRLVTGWHLNHILEEDNKIKEYVRDNPKVQRIVEGIDELLDKRIPEASV